MVLLHSVSLPLQSPAPEFELKDTAEKSHKISNYKGKKAVILIFTCNHCPYAQAIWPLVIDLAKKYQHQDVQFLAINPNINPDYPEDSFPEMQKFALQNKLPFPYLVDETQKVARQYQAQCTPDIYVYDEGLKLAYHGRLNDNWQEPDKVTSHDLEAAIKKLLQGEAPNEKQMPSMGCSIKWKE